MQLAVCDHKQTNHRVVVVQLEQCQQDQQLVVRTQQALVDGVVPWMSRRGRDWVVASWGWRRGNCDQLGGSHGYGAGTHLVGTSGWGGTTSDWGGAATIRYIVQQPTVAGYSGQRAAM